MADNGTQNIPGLRVIRRADQDTAALDSVIRRQELSLLTLYIRKYPKQAQQIVQNLLAKERRIA